MKSAPSPSIDFNQMLVVSVFFHFFLFTVIMFLPPTQNAVKHIRPAFMVSLMSIPTGPDQPPLPLEEKAPVVPPPPVKPVVQKKVPEKPKPEIDRKPEPKPKPVPEKPPASHALVSKLDQVALLEKKAAPKKDKTAPVSKPRENILSDFEKMKMKTASEKKKKPTRKKIAKDDLTLKELEFEHLSKQSAKRRSPNKPQMQTSLLKELDELDELNKQAYAALEKPQLKQSHTPASELVKQLESIKKEGVDIRIDTSQLSSRHSQKFKSNIRNLKLAEIQRKATAPAASGNPGDPGADALSRYVGEVYVKIFKNWKDPLGGGSGRVQVSFAIFPGGNIDMPKILTSSGDPKLDNLAIRAIKNAVPLPPFPREIREPSLPLILKFDYVPSKN